LNELNTLFGNLVKIVSRRQCYDRKAPWRENESLRTQIAVLG